MPLFYIEICLISFSPSKSGDSHQKHLFFVSTNSNLISKKSWHPFLLGQLTLGQTNFWFNSWYSFWNCPLSSWGPSWHEPSNPTWLAGRLVLGRLQLQRPMYNFKKFSPWFSLNPYSRIYFSRKVFFLRYQNLLTHVELFQRRAVSQLWRQENQVKCYEENTHLGIYLLPYYPSIS